MTSVVLILIFLILGFIFYRLKLFFKKKLFKNFQYKSETKTKQSNPDINTTDWDLHKNRLKKKRR